MTVDRLKRDLLNKLINARIDLAAYLRLRKAKGYMSVSESDVCVITCLNFAISCVKKHRPCRRTTAKVKKSRCAAPPRCSPLQGCV